jgi:tetratricopeptide (TPR) repeat protein
MAPFEALREALRPALAHGTPEEREHFAGPLATLFPEFATSPPPPGSENVAPVLRWLGAVAERLPLLVIFDDVHWADPETVDVINRGVAAVAGHRVLLLVTLRDDETPAGSTIWRTLEDGTSERMGLAPLDRAGLAALLTSLLPGARLPGGFLESLHRATGGNPLFIQSALNVLLEEGHLRREGGTWRFPLDPSVLEGLERVEGTLQRRLAHLAPTSLEVLQAAAVLGQRWTLCTLAAVSGVPEDTLFTALEDLTHRQLLARDETGACHFPHDRVREVAYAALAQPARAALHRRAGQALEAIPGVDAHELGRHYRESGDDDRAWGWLARAGHQALAAGASYTALEHFRDADRALSRLPGDHLPERLPLWLIVGQHGFNIATGLAAQVLSEAEEALEADPARVESLLRGMGRSLADLYTLCAATMGLWGEPARAMRAVARLEALTPDDGSPASALPLVASLPALLVAGRLDAVVARARIAAKRLASLPTHAPPLLLTARIAAWGAHNAIAFQGLRPDPAPRDQALALARALGDDDPYLPWFYFGVWAAWTGHTEEADAYLERTAEKNRKLGGPPHVWLLYLVPFLRWQRGEPDAALEQLERNLTVYPHLTEHSLALMLCRALRGHVLLELGRHPEAQAAFDDLVDEVHTRGHGLAWQLGLYGQGLARLHLGQAQAATESFEALREAARSTDLRNPLSEAYALQGLGQVGVVTGSPAALGHLDAALAIARRPEMDNMFQQAAVQHLRGHALQQARRQADAVVALEEAGRLYQRQRNHRWLQQLRADLQAAREAPQRPPDAAVEARFERFKGMM